MSRIDSIASNFPTVLKNFNNNRHPFISSISNPTGSFLMSSIDKSKPSGDHDSINNSKTEANRNNYNPISIIRSNKHSSITFASVFKSYSIDKENETTNTTNPSNNNTTTTSTISTINPIINSTTITINNSKSSFTVPIINHNHNNNQSSPNRLLYN